MLLVIFAIIIGGFVGWFSLYQQNTFIELLLSILPPVGYFLYYLFRFSFVAAANSDYTNGVALFFSLPGYLPLDLQTACLVSFMAFWAVRVGSWVYKKGVEPNVVIEDETARKARIRGQFGMSEEDTLTYKRVNHKRAAR